INIVILGDGYQASEFSKFETDANNVVNAMFGQSPFKEYSNYFNVYIIKVPSNESGASHPGNASDIENCPSVPITVVDNYFGTRYDFNGIHRLLYTSNYVNIYDVLAENFPLYDQILLLVNAPYYGGGGGDFAIFSTGTSSNEIAIHEIGHSLFNLRDEYYPGDTLVREGPNMTQVSDPNLVKWTNWMSTNGVGIYAHCSTGNCATWYRPHQLCKMRYLGYPFCSVCNEAMIEKIHDFVSPIDSYLPATNHIENLTFPIDFNLTLVKPLPNTLESSWHLNSNNFASNVDGMSILETDLIEGINNLTVVVADNTAMQRIDNHDTIHIHTVNWTIDYSTLGIKEITSEENNLSISMYPNPSQDLLNFSYKNALGSNLTVEIMSLDGKKLITANLSNNEISAIDISSFSSGIYLVNFYSNKVVVASKKLVKK
ncbi:MAG: M64 family metallopeptidase, partial [Xanthomarina sp.]